MQAVFRFRGDEEIVISNYVGGVLVEIIRSDGEPHSPAHPQKEPLRTLLTLSKSESRSVASAIMGAAAEL